MMCGLKTASTVVAKFTRENLPDGLIVLGVVALSYGAWLVYVPAGFITGGALLLALGVLAARKQWD